MLDVISAIAFLSRMVAATEPDKSPNTGPDSSVYAYSRLTVQRNLYRIPLK
jgi:hypothetical protein